MPYNLSLSLSKSLSVSTTHPRIDQGALLYLHQNEQTIGGRILTAYLEEVDQLLECIENTLFVAIARLLTLKNNEAYHQLDVAKNLHIRIESISKGECLYDSLVLGIPSQNKTLSIGTSEKSFTSFILTHCALWKKYVYDYNFQTDYMYRKFLHLGKKAPQFEAYIEQRGSMLWHALYSDSLPQSLIIDTYHPVNIEGGIPF